MSPLPNNGDTFLKPDAEKSSCHACLLSLPFSAWIRFYIVLSHPACEHRFRFRSHHLFDRIYHHTDLRKTRAAGQSIIPVETGLAAGIGRVLPALEDKFSARALRVPTTNVSIMELSLQVAKTAGAESVNNALRQSAANDLMGVLGVTDEPLASCDFNHDPRSGIVDLGQTRVSGDIINVLVWFDNEWGYANRMLDIVGHWFDVKREK